MGRFDYPSPYWDPVGDPALDLIDRMLTVDVSKRITIDECLDHPWTRDINYINPADSIDGLTGVMNSLDFSKRKVQRERTLLANINDIKVSKVVDITANRSKGDEGSCPPTDASPAHVKVWEKNPGGKNRMASQGKGKKAVANAKEEHPAANRHEMEFMGMGGKGDMQLFGNDISSRYLPEEVPKTVGKKK